MHSVGKITEPPGANIRVHERDTAEALARAGYEVEFVREHHRHRIVLPDVLINGEYWEMKSPKTNKISQLEMNLKRASRQSPNIILDSQRIKDIPDDRVQKFLIERFIRRRNIKKLLFITKRREIIDISKLI